MPYAVAKDNVRLHFEEAGSGTPIIFLHEFAADHTNWEPQMRYFSRGHRCIAYSARGYTPSDVPPSAEVYTYKHFYTDALAVLDHLDIAKAHFIGLSMGSYSSLQIGLNAPERALSMTLAAVGSGSNIENLDAFRAQCRANAEQYEIDRFGGSGESDARGAEPDSVPAEGSARPRRFLCGAGAARRQGLGQHHAQLSGRAAVDLHADGCDPESADAGADSVRRRGRQLRRAEPVPEAASARRRGFRFFPSRATCSIWKSRRCSTRWSSDSSRWSKPADGRCAIRGRW